VKYEILPNGNLRLTVDNREELEDAEDIEELMEDLIATSELDWICPSVCGDLTDAPMLAILNCEEEPVAASRGSGRVLTRRWQDWSVAVTHRWGWMDYAVKDLFDELREKGCAVLIAP
jgi:hypothetical protein